ncbi:hypothetical protein DM01DRAFT_264589 [Hesseltinella vesiculosa]|uniref:Uncharacterized protein n=1 Tax=Hesseltinella vesiculosa TaxID=101127 RepID=A0A1X2G8J2_9FUNG|nr:hypothetical protein DM01DRAFT_264589 [Hesseltinella vesiculosa]
MSSLASLIANVKSNTAGNSLVKKNLAVTKKRQAARYFDPAGKTTKKAKSPQVIVFDGSALTKRPTMESKAAKKAFLRSKNETLDAYTLGTPDTFYLSENLRKDKELQQLLATSRLLEEYQVDEMSGKERRKHMFGKMEELGMKVNPAAKLGDAYSSFYTPRAPRKKRGRWICIWAWPVRRRNDNTRSYKKQRTWACTINRCVIFMSTPRKKNASETLVSPLAWVV